MAAAKIVVASLFVMGGIALNINRPSGHECDCLNWKDTYMHGHARCGNAFEFSRRMTDYDAAQPKEWLMMASSTWYDMRKMDGADYCEGFFKKIDDNKCARAFMGSSDIDYQGKSWCYTWDKCKGAISTTMPNTAVKLCEELGDAPLLEAVHAVQKLADEELAERARAMSSD